MTGTGSGPQFVRLGGVGVELAADAYGTATDPPVVLLHGGGQTRHSWGGTAAMLAAQGYYAVSVDLRGHGDSDWSPDGQYGHDRFGADAARLVDEIRDRTGSDPALVGASLGGISSLLAIGEHAAPATCLVLVDITARIEADGARRIGAFMMKGVDGFDSLEDVADAIASYNPHRPRPNDLSGLRKNVRLHDDGRWYWHWDPRFMSMPATAADGVAPSVGGHERLKAAAARVEAPTLIVRGRLSDIVSDEGIEEMRMLIPHAEVADVSGAGHMVAGDRNDAFNNAIIAFLTATFPGRS